MPTASGTVMEPVAVHTPDSSEYFSTALIGLVFAAPLEPSATYRVSGPAPVPNVTKATPSGPKPVGRLAPVMSAVSVGVPPVGRPPLPTALMLVVVDSYNCALEPLPTTW